jgi:hypothetical protein
MESIGFFSGYSHCPDCIEVALGFVSRPGHLSRQDIARHHWLLVGHLAKLNGRSLSVRKRSPVVRN